MSGAACALCGTLSDRILADYLNKGEVLPEEAGKLTPLIGENSHDCPTIRRCPGCSRLFMFYADRDSSGGENGWGTNEEYLARITVGKAIDLLNRMLEEYESRRKTSLTAVGSGTRSKVRQREMAAAYATDIRKIKKFLKEFKGPKPRGARKRKK